MTVPTTLMKLAVRMAHITVKPQNTSVILVNASIRVGSAMGILIVKIDQMNVDVVSVDLILCFIMLQSWNSIKSMIWDFLFSLA